MWNDVLCESGDEISFQTAGAVLRATSYPDGIERALPLNRCDPVQEPNSLDQVLGLAPLRVLAGKRV